MDHVRFREYGTTARYSWRVFRLQGYLTELLNRETQSRCLLIKEGSRTGGTERVHGKILYSQGPIISGRLEYNELRIFATNIDSTTRMRIEPTESFGDRNYLIYTGSPDKG
jgi:hypothetical protein